MINVVILLLFIWIYPYILFEMTSVEKDVRVQSVFSPREMFGEVEVIQLVVDGDCVSVPVEGLMKMKVWGLEEDVNLGLVGAQSQLDTWEDDLFDPDRKIGILPLHYLPGELKHRLEVMCLKNEGYRWQPYLIENPSRLSPRIESDVYPPVVEAMQSNDGGLQHPLLDSIKVRRLLGGSGWGDAFRSDLAEALVPARAIYIKSKQIRIKGNNNQTFAHEFFAVVPDSLELAEVGNLAQLHIVRRDRATFSGGWWYQGVTFDVHHLDSESTQTVVW